MKADNQQQAVQKASEAFYKQSGLDIMVKNLKNRYVSKDVQKYSGWLIVGYNTIDKQEVKYVWEWTF